MTASLLPRRRFLARALAALGLSGWTAGSPRKAEAQDLPYVAEIRLFAGWFAPAGWHFCHGQLLPIDEQYNALFTIIGTMYGGDGQNNFALPDLRSRVPLHAGTGLDGISWTIGETAGTEEVFLVPAQLPSHNHPAGASAALGVSDHPATCVPARNAAGVPQYGSFADASLAPGTLAPVGGSTPHNNMQPFLGVHFIICWSGEFPSPS